MNILSKAFTHFDGMICLLLYHGKNKEKNRTKFLMVPLGRKAKNKGLRKQTNLEAADEENHAVFLETVKSFKRRKDIGAVAIGVIFSLHLETAMP